MFAYSAGAYTATLLVMVNVMRGGGRAPPTLTSQGPILPSPLNVRQKAAVVTLCTLWLYHSTMYPYTCMEHGRNVPFLCLRVNIIKTVYVYLSISHSSSIYLKWHLAAILLNEGQKGTATVHCTMTHWPLIHKGEDSMVSF